MRRDGGGPVSCKEAQQLYGLGTEPAANLKPNNNQPAAPRMLELGVGLMPFAPGRCGDGDPRLDIGMRVGLAAPCEGADDGGVEGEL